MLALYPTVHWSSTSNRSPSFSPQILRVFEGYPQTKIFEDPQKKLKSLSYFLGTFYQFFEVFRGILEKPQKSCPHSHLEIWEFLRVRSKYSQLFLATLTSKILKCFRNYNPQPQKPSKFENENENSHDLRARFTTL